MVKKQKRSRHAAKGSSQFEPLGDWPTINLVLTDDSGSVDYAYDPRASKRRRKSSASVKGKRGCTFDFHTRLTLDETTCDDIRVELEKHTKAGRQRAYGILRRSTQFKGGGPAGKRMIQHALQALSP